MTVSATDPATTRRSPWWGLAVLALPTLLSAVDINVLFLALPALTRDLGASAVEQLWITDVYGFLVAGLVITMGTLGDRVGHRRLLFTGAAVFAVTSVAAACAPDPTVLIGLRALLGVAGATLMPATLALITALFGDREQRGVAIAIWATCQFAGAALGPVVGGVLLGHFWWGSVFLLAVPVMVVLLVAGPFVLPAGTGDGSGRLDLASVALSLLAVLPVVWGVKVLATGTAPVALAVAAVVAGLAIGVVFVRRQLHLDRPLLDLALFRVRRVTVLLAALVGAGVAMAGTGMLVTQYLQTVLGYSPVASALWFAPMGLGVAAGTLLTPVIVRWVRPHVAVSGGLVLAALGALLLVLTPAEGGAPVAVGAVTVLALGTGPLFARGIGAVVGAVPSTRAGAAASLAETGNYLGGALGLALLGTLAAASYRAAMSGADGVARETVSGAATVAAALPAPQAGELLAAAHAAFTGGLHLVGVVAAALFVALAVATSRITLEA
ncbi:DHA2 family multidrug resistance protein-like MFS transporter [Actinomycetospora succinea]|uniref:DHA2 family multidrug resistance protein-like MFS transporter n=1 Tax=Actinomycetospora succinea TaxID=663603 RepID=A0A4R6VAF9_9PSEU|nr:MFS transporter [Actinomycetospora succinea]TDQ55918.1 DHA2 family multidrug resistance protein-like MFS transporter [Actinomycetospora succinea]